jgi:hypothetical protein
VNGLSWWISDRVGEGKAEKTGGANAVPKKTPCERDPLRELQGLHAANKLSGLMAWSG